jgi:hypothetical protein
MKVYRGNHGCNSYLLRQGIRTATTPTNTRGKYDNEVAEMYRMMLKARLEGRPDPPNLHHYAHSISSLHPGQNNNQHEELPLVLQIQPHHHDFYLPLFLFTNLQHGRAGRSFLAESVTKYGPLRAWRSLWER